VSIQFARRAAISSMAPVFQPRSRQTPADEAPTAGPGAVPDSSLGGPESARLGG